MYLQVKNIADRIDYTKVSIPESKLEVIKKSTGVDFNLKQSIDLLRSVTNNFSDNPADYMASEELIKDFDNLIMEVVSEFGNNAVEIPEDIEKDDVEVVEKTEEETMDEINSTIEGLEMLLEDDPENEDLISTIEGLKLLI